MPILAKMLSVDPLQRPSAFEVLESLGCDELCQRLRSLVGTYVPDNTFLESVYLSSPEALSVRSGTPKSGTPASVSGASGVTSGGNTRKRSLSTGFAPTLPESLPPASIPSVTAAAAAFGVVVRPPSRAAAIRGIAAAVATAHTSAEASPPLALPPPPREEDAIVAEDDATVEQDRKRVHLGVYSQTHGSI